ncbi:MAG TPA: hypothetical protein VIX73_30130 [Kofleriaceae bacterium]
MLRQLLSIVLDAALGLGESLHVLGSDTARRVVARLHHRVHVWELADAAGEAVTGRRAE